MHGAAPAGQQAVGDRFQRACSTVVGWLPFGLNSVVPPTLLGFALINGFTFAVDLALLTVLHSWAALPVPVAVAVAYACAFTLSFYLNRTMNFASHAPVGRQFAVYVVVVVVNYLALVVAVTTALTAVGVDVRIARILAGGCEAVYMYCAMRWVVFRR